MRKRVQKREGVLEQERHVKVLLVLSIVNKSLFSDVWHLSIFTIENRKRLYKITDKNMKLAEVRVVFLFRLIIGFFFFPFVLPPLLLLLVRDKSQLTRFNKFCFLKYTHLLCHITRSWGSSAAQRPRLSSGWASEAPRRSDLRGFKAAAVSVSSIEVN